MFDGRSRVLGFLTLLHDAAVTAVVFFVAHRVRVDFLPQLGWWPLPPIYPVEKYLPLLLAAVVVFPLAGVILGAYRHVELSTPTKLVADIAGLVGVGLTVIYAGLFVSHADYVSRSFVLLLGAMEVLLLIVSRWVFFASTAWVRERSKKYIYFLIVGTGTKARAAADLLEQSEFMGLRLVGFVAESEKAPRTMVTRSGEYAVIQSSQLAATLGTEVIDEVVFAVEMEDLVRLQPLMRDCACQGVNTRLQLEFVPQPFSRVYVERLRHVPMLTLSVTPDSHLLLLGKRTFDIVVSAVALLLLSPLTLLVALLIKATSPGPVLYRQVRSGLGGRHFTLYKFRTMVENAENERPALSAFNELRGPVFKMSNDPRVTPLGRWLRRFSIDELPQFWNVLLGDMSFVGPRPALPAEVEQYEPWQRRRLRMRPGLTCTWVLEGRNSVEFDRVIQLDLSYIDNWSLWLDLKISLLTIPLVLTGKGAY
jgi:exopolysaccharide biosynthesis polyprenyl glycosylphosphotransferase